MVVVHCAFCHLTVSPDVPNRALADVGTVGVNDIVTDEDRYDHCSYPPLTRTRG